MLRLPPYAPDVNPVQRATAKVRAPPRKEGAGTVERLLGEIAAAMGAATAGDATNFIRHGGYAATAA